jgi:hypothetical protein
MSGVRTLSLEKVLTVLVAVGAAVTAGFLPTYLSGRYRGLDGIIGVSGAVVLMGAVYLRWQLGRRRRGGSLIVFAPMESWQSPELWLHNAMRYGRSRFEVQQVVTRRLPHDPSRWKAAMEDLGLLLGSAMNEGAAVASATGELSLLVNAPWPVAWRIGADLGMQRFDVFQPAAEESGFFAAVGVNRKLKANPPNGSSSMITLEKEPMHADGTALAVTLSLASHAGVIAQSQAACDAHRVRERLVVQLADRFNRIVPDDKDTFERLVREVGATVRGYLEGQSSRTNEPGGGEAMGGQGSPVGPVYVFASMPVSVAVGLGAFFANAWDFHLMHYVDGTYREADLR